VGFSACKDETPQTEVCATKCTAIEPEARKKELVGTGISSQPIPGATSALERRVTASREPSRKLLIAGGGTGGHVFPALAVAREWMSREGEREVVFVGTQRGI
jgi:hypothetical protein